LFISISGIAPAQKNQLKYYVGEAFANSPLLKDFKDQVESNTYDSLLIKATYKPQVTGSSYNSYAPVIKGYGYDGAITNGGNFNALIGVNKLLLNKKLTGAQFQNLQLQNQSLNNAAQLTEQDLKRTITAQYIIAYGDQQQINFNKEINILLLKEEVILKKLTQGNVYKQVDYLSFLVTLQQQELLIKQLEIQFKNDAATLNYLSGITDTSFVVLQDPELSLASLPDINSSVFLKKFAIDSLKLSNNRVLVAAAYRPKINLFADAGFNSSLAYSPYKNFGTSFGISASIPIYDGKQKKMQYSKINIAERTRNTYKDFFIKQYNQQVAQLNQQLKVTDDMITTINKQIKYAESLIQVNEKLLETGEAHITDYILALNNYINAKNLVTQHTINRLQIINQINYWNR
jgi:outer membrane protein TolC